MYKSGLTVLLLASSFSLSNCLYHCYQCATTGLQNQWQFTGLLLPPNLSSNFFSDQCSNLPSVTNIPVQNNCPDFCFAMHIFQLNKNGGATFGDDFWIRGCHADFAGFPFRGASGGSLQGTINCQSGFIRRYQTNSSTAVDTPAFYSWCNSDIDPNGNTSCNLQTGNTPTCTPVKVQQQKNCYDCMQGSSVLPCTSSSTNSGSYCYKYDHWINDQEFVTKSISDINPLYPGADGDLNSGNQPQNNSGKCVTYTNGNPASGGGYITYKSTDSYCNWDNLCNGDSLCSGAMTKTMFNLFIMIAITLILFKF